MNGRRSGATAALATAGTAIALALLAVVVAALSGLTGTELLSHGFAGIPVLAISAAASGGAICRHRPDNLVGWLLIASGLVAAVSIGAIALLPISVEQGWEWGLQLVLAHLVLTAWTGWLLLIPLVLLVFPAGAFGSLPVKVLAAAVAVAWLLLLASLVADPAPWGALTDFGVPADYPLAITPGLGALAGTALAPAAAGLTAAMFALTAGLDLVVLIVPVVRYVRGDPQLRRQLLWVLLAAGSVVALVASQALPTLLGPVVGPPLVPALFALVPLGVAVAVISGNAFGLHRSFARTLSWILATALLISAFTALVVLLSPVFATSAGPVVAAVAVALAFDPLRRRIQRLADRVLFGADPSAEAAIGIIGSGLRGTSDLDGLLERLRASLRLQRLALWADDRTIAAAGDPSGQTVSLPLVYAGRSVGTLEYVDDEPRLRDVTPTLALLTPVLAGLVELTTTSAQLIDSRGDLVRSTEQERRRLQRDLHDGVSSAIAGIAWKLEGIRLGASDEVTARRLEDAHGDVLRVGQELRRVIDDLAPPELEVLGLDGALREAVAASPDVPTLAPVRLSTQRLGDAVLPAAVELAAYRIVLEAVANARRHARPEQIDVALEVDDSRLSIVIADRGGPPQSPDTEAGNGVGLDSMRHRAEMLGGALDAGPTPDGWRVAAVIPVASHA